MKKTKVILQKKWYEIKGQVHQQWGILAEANLKNIPGKKILMVMLVIFLSIGMTACNGITLTASQQSTATSVAENSVVDIDKLSDVLLYHMVNDALNSSELAALNSVITRQGAAIKITYNNNALVLNDNVNVVEVDINACNGVIHVIDQMLTLADLNMSETAQATELTATMEATIEIPTAVVSPEATPISCQAGQSIADILRAEERFSSFAGALEMVGLMDVLDQDGAFTVFAPPNDVFISPTKAFIAPTLGLNGEKITICHATGSSTNPYNEITIDSNGLNGHENHQNDIIPAPVGGCPVN